MSCLVATSGRAQSSEGAPANVNTVQGALAGSARYIGMAGAFVAIAQDTDGIATNPAASALRMPYSWQDWDYEVGGDLAIGDWLPTNNFFNRSSQTSETKDRRALFGSVAATLYYRHFGVGISAEAQQNAATRRDMSLGISSNFTASFGTVHASIAYGFFDGQLLLGAGPRFVGLSFERSGRGPLSAAGGGYEAGFIVKPIGQQFRLGASVKSPLYAEVPDDEGEATSVHVPWEIALGAAYQLGTPRLNPRFVTARDVVERRNAGRPATRAELKKAADELFAQYQRADRFYVLMSAELAFVQGMRGHAGFEQYWSEGAIQPVAGVMLSPRLGAESEVVPHILRVRGGSYYESPLVGGVVGRIHGTGGLDVRLFEWSVFGLLDHFDYWRLSVAADVASDYLSTAVSVGLWH